MVGVKKPDILLFRNVEYYCTIQDSWTCQKKMAEKINLRIWRLRNPIPRHR